MQDDHFRQQNARLHKLRANYGWPLTPHARDAGLQTEMQT
jgi:hypothetical protein